MKTTRNGTHAWPVEGRSGFATLTVLLLALALLVMVMGLSRYVASFRRDVRLIEQEQRKRVAPPGTNALSFRQTTVQTNLVTPP
jgi:hypothetical protein